MSEVDYPAEWFGGCRTLAEQMAGLEPVLESASGASVLDLGCAEGHIAAEFIKRRSSPVHGCEILIDRVEAARKYVGPSGLFFTCDLNHLESFLAVNRRPLLARYSIVLALSIAHKLERPDHFLSQCAGLCADILAVRLPSAVLDDKRSKAPAFDVRRFLGRRAFALQDERPGPRGEWVGIFRRQV